VSVALGMQHAMRIRQWSVACSALQCFSMLSLKRLDFGGDENYWT